MKNVDIIGKKCRRGLTIKVCRSGGGTYLGTYDDYAPNCRITNYYSSSESLKDDALQLRFAMENEYCNGGKGCLCL